MEEPARILIVDDDENIRKILKAVLEKECYMVDTAATGEEALRKSNAKSYNVALIDIRLPDLKGTELLTNIDVGVSKMVKIIMTGFPTLDNAVEAINKDADAYILKPFNMENLLKTIEKHLERQRRSIRFDEMKVVEFVESRTKKWRQEKAESYKRE